MIKSSTGKTKKNKPVDVAALQILLNKISLYQKTDPVTGVVANSASAAPGYTKLASLKVDGTSKVKLAARIEAYQRAKNMKVVDGWISPSGKTLKTLLTDAGVVAGTKRMPYLRSEIVNMCLMLSAVKPLQVITLYEKQYRALSTQDKAGLKYILDTAKSDADVTRITELAYMLATTKHETAHTFRAIEEYGKGSGRTYGAEISVSHTDAAKKTTVYKNKYYGRGYVQLTWGYNYQRIDEKLGNGTYPNKNKTKAVDYNKGFTISKPAQSVYLHPAKMLEKGNAYTAMVYGMQKGIFTGRKISRYVNAVKTDYFNARRVINGTDKAQAIANYADDFELLMLLSTK